MLIPTIQKYFSGCTKRCTIVPLRLRQAVRHRTQHGSFRPRIDRPTKRCSANDTPSHRCGSMSKTIADDQRQRSRIRDLAGQLHGLRSRLYRSGGKNFAAPGKPLRAKSVTYVLGTICYLCVRSGHSSMATHPSSPSTSIREKEYFSHELRPF